MNHRTDNFSENSLSEHFKDASFHDDLFHFSRCILDASSIDRIALIIGVCRMSNIFILLRGLLVLFMLVVLDRANRR